MSFRPILKFFFWVLVVDFIILMWIGSEHPNSPFVEVGQFATVIYFAWFLIIVPFVGIIENSLFDIGLTKGDHNKKAI
jgi:ubiquinol-cytochrome c reductase cytochrome b subunit